MQLQSWFSHDAAHITLAIVPIEKCFQIMMQNGLICPFVNNNSASYDFESISFFVYITKSYNYVSLCRAPGTLWIDKVGTPQASVTHGTG